MPVFDPKSVQKILTVKSSKYTMFALPKMAKAGLKDPSHLPFSIRILLESALRNYDN